MGQNVGFFNLKPVSTKSFKKSDFGSVSLCYTKIEFMWGQMLITRPEGVSSEQHWQVTASVCGAYMIVNQ